MSAQMFYFASTLLVMRILVSSEYGVMAFAGFWTYSSRHAGMLAEMGLVAAIIPPA